MPGFGDDLVGKGFARGSEFDSQDPSYLQNHVKEARLVGAHL